MTIQRNWKNSVNSIAAFDHKYMKQAILQLKSKKKNI